MVDSVKDSVGDVQDRRGEMTVDVMGYKEKNKKNALFMVAVIKLLKEIVQKLINNEAARAELLQKLEAALEEAQAAESSKAFWEKLRQGVLAEIEQQLKALNDKTAEKVSAKVEVLQQQLDHFFQQVDTVSALTAQFEAQHPAIIDSIATISADLADIEETLKTPVIAPEELITLSEHVADIRKNYTAVQEKFEHWVKELQEAALQLNAAAAAVQDPTVAGIGSAAVAPGIAPHLVAPISITPASAPSLDPVAPLAAAPSIVAPSSPVPAMLRPAIEISHVAMPRPVSRPVLKATPAPKPSFIVDDSTQQLLASFGLPTTLFVGAQQKRDHIERELNALGLRIGAAEETIVYRAKQHPGLEIEIGNNPNGFASSPYIFLKNPDVASGKPRPSVGRSHSLREEEEARLAALFRPSGLSRSSS